MIKKFIWKKKKKRNKKKTQRTKVVCREFTNKSMSLSSKLLSLTRDRLYIPLLQQSLAVLSIPPRWTTLIYALLTLRRRAGGSSKEDKGGGRRQVVQVGLSGEAVEASDKWRIFVYLLTVWGGVPALLTALRRAVERRRLRNYREGVAEGNVSRRVMEFVESAMNVVGSGENRTSVFERDLRSSSMLVEGFAKICLMLYLLGYTNKSRVGEHLAGVEVARVGGEFGRAGKFLGGLIAAEYGIRLSKLLFRSCLERIFRYNGGARRELEGGGAATATASSEEPPESEGAEPPLERGRKVACGICRDTMKDGSIIKNCGHSGCWECLVIWVNAKGTCPICRLECSLRDIILLEGFC